MIQVGSRIGMQTMKDSVFKLLDEGIITKETAKATLNSSTEGTAEGDEINKGGGGF
jgi:Tfp pilus assembly pilus retraction ATPase PilT